MRRSALFSALAVVAVALPSVAQTAGQQLTCRNGRCERVVYGSAPATPRLRVSANGPVNIEAGVSRNLTYSVKLVVNMRTEAEARHALSAYAVRLEQRGLWTTLTAPGGGVQTTVTIKAPKLT